ncbi:MAG: hypothetical protein ACYS76_05855, partial [Planctomycetota bacterium]
KPGGKGFVGNANVHTLKPNPRGGYTGPWGHAGTANLCLLRYRQVQLDGYRRLGLDAANLYLDRLRPLCTHRHWATLFTLWLVHTN